MSDGMDDGSDDDYILGKKIMERFLDSLKDPQKAPKCHLPSDIIPMHLDPNMSGKKYVREEHEKSVADFLTALEKKDEKAWSVLLSEIARSDFESMLYDFVAISPFAGKLVGYLECSLGHITLHFPGFKRFTDWEEMRHSSFVAFNVNPKDVVILPDPFTTR